MRVAAAAAGFLVAGVAMAGCGKLATGINGSNGTCTVALSGALTGTYSCAPVGLAFNSTKDTTGYAFSVSAGGSQPSIIAAISWAGQAATVDYVNAPVANSGGGVVVTTLAGGTWAAQTGTGAQGTWDLKLTGLGAQVTTGSGTAYAPTGTLTATLPAVSGTGASGTITVSVAF